MPLFKKKIPKNPTICCQFDQTQPKKHLGRKRFFPQREWLGSSPLHYSSISYRVGFSTLYTCIHPSQPPPTPLRFIVHGIFLIKSIIYQVGRSTCNITFNSQGILSKKKNTQLYRKKFMHFKFYILFKMKFAKQYRYQNDLINGISIIFFVLLMASKSF